MKKIFLSSFLAISPLLYAFSIGYYIRPSGNNLNSGKASVAAWKDLTNINTTVFIAGDTIYLEQGNIYNGNIYFDENDGGTATNPVNLTSWNPAATTASSKATINGGTNTAIYAYNSAGIKISNLVLTGSSSTKDGIALYCDLPDNGKKDYIHLDNLEISGFKSGITLGSWNQNAGYTNVTISESSVHDNVRGGIFTYAQTRVAHNNVRVTNCKVYNNFGDVSVTNTNTGSGIVLSGVNGGKIDHCIAYNNGKNNRNPSGGPVGIWCYESNNVVIEYNESYGNKAGLTHDGGGFDIDGGSTNCIMQYNYSHDNEGPGYLFAQFAGASITMDKNICRYNFSINDGRKNDAGGINIWAAGGYNISNTAIYGNTIYMTPSLNGTAYGIYVLPGTNTTNTAINNNLIVTTGGVKLIQASSTAGIMLKGNGYWASDNSFAVGWGGNNYNSLAGFRAAGQETGSGIYANPLLNNPGTAITLNNTALISTLTDYKLQPNSPMIDAGISINDTGLFDFYGSSVPQNMKFDIGAHETSSVTGILADPKAAIAVYPNPAATRLALRMDAEPITKAELISINGIRYMLPRADVQRGELKVDSYPRGLYILQCTSTKGVARISVVLE